MPRSGSGVYTLPEAAFVAGTVIQSAAVNSDLSDIATALTQSLATTGVSAMTGPIQAAAGSNSAPSYTFAAATGTGFYLSGTNEISWTANGTVRAVFAANGNVGLVAGLSVGGDLNVVGSAGVTGPVGLASTLEVLGQLFIANGSVAAPGLAFGNNLGVGLFIVATNAMAIGVASVSVMTIRASATITFAANVTVSNNLEVGGNLAVTGSATYTTSVNSMFPGAILAIVEDNKTSGTAPDNLTIGADTVRTLNTLVYNRGSLVSVSSNRFTLPAGTWEIAWWAEIGGNLATVAVFHQSFLYNFTDSVEVKRGTSGFVEGASEDTADGQNSYGQTVVTIAASKAFEIRHRTNGTGTPQQGYAASLGTEVYSRVIVRYA